ncbi:MAG: electron transfer flavoprotein subunit beta/FixA family protein [Desulfobacterota bacterium]|nr:electron transfer flavoprotein subunit beta/FixA family protein [Thermodesulfobacteriota bacterium]MDW8001411.1 electron transfer flavoprotein subunit beta/FixA family protein [Deltaproteobacteria bacterium]
MLVFVKQILDSEAKLSIKDDGKSIDYEERFSLNFFDEFAIEEAIRIKEKWQSCEIVAVSYGPKKAQEVLRTAIAMGGDRGILIEAQTYGIGDPGYTAKILATFAKNEGFDMILCGERAMDDENGIMGVLVAESLDVPYVGSVVKMEFEDEKTVTVDSEIDGELLSYKVELPAVFSLRKGINEPRVPAITGVMKAMRAQIPSIEPTSLISASPRTVILGYEPPPKRPAVKIIEGKTPKEKVTKLVALLKEEAKAL